MVQPTEIFLTGVLKFMWFRLKMLLDYICEDCTHMPEITIVLPLYSDLESSGQVMVGEF